MIFLNPRTSLLWQYISFFKDGRVPLIRQLREELFSVQTEQEPGEVVRSQCQRTATTTSNSCGDQWIYRFEAYLLTVPKADKSLETNASKLTSYNESHRLRGSALHGTEPSPFLVTPREGEPVPIQPPSPPSHAEPRRRYRWSGISCTRYPSFPAPRDDQEAARDCTAPRRNDETDEA